MTKTTKTSWRELKEKLADIEHQRWADWQKWCHKILRENCPSPELEKVLKRWDKQISTNYKDLTEKEKDSDREQVDRYLPILQKELEMEEVTTVNVSKLEAGDGNGQSKWKMIRNSEEAKYGWNEAVKEFNSKLKALGK